MILAITQARFGSKRLPGKVLREIDGKPVLQIHLERLKRSKMIDRIVVATTFEPEADSILSVAQKMGISTFQGSTTDVLERYYTCAVENDPKYIVRVTSDCPLIDPAEIDNLVNFFLRSASDYGTNSFKPTFPDGVDVEIFTLECLKKTHQSATSPEDREHVSPYMLRNSTLSGAGIFNGCSYAEPFDFFNYRLTLDTQTDFDNIRVLIENLGDKKGWKEYVEFIDKNIDLFDNIK